MPSGFVKKKSPVFPGTFLPQSKNIDDWTLQLFTGLNYGTLTSAVIGTTFKKMRTDERSLALNIV